jgi:SAM-dependent methyltransferase
MPVYDRAFFENQHRQSYASAMHLLPHVFDELAPVSVLDVGCGVGPWLSAALDLGAEDVVGVDGDYVDRSQLLIPSDAFVSHDLSTPLDLGRRFDLAMSLEVAEHLPPSAGEGFVRSLTRHADVVLFSAGIPWQGGTHHVNLRWQTYWAELFRREEFKSVDIRSLFWRDNRIGGHYRQNVVLYTKRSLTLQPPPLPLDVVHPEVWSYVLEIQANQKPSTREIVRHAPGAVRSSASRLLRRLTSR